jgi:ABC-type sugar transport system ATPase subunit
VGKTILTAQHITKLFPGMKALDDVDFDLKEGEVHILVGENGAGKSTLAKIILGAYKADEGEIFFKGTKMYFNGTKDALAQGIAAVYQEFTLIPYLNAAQNIFLNREYRNKFGLLDLKKMEKEAKQLLHILNCDYIDIRKPVKMLSTAEQQMVEIAKALSFKPKVLVFDEPTSSLSDREVDSLFKQILKLKKEGIGIIYVSHRMQEFPLIGDRITILRDGKKIATVGIKEKTNKELVNMMVGRDVSQVYKRSENKFIEEAIRVENLRDRSGIIKGVSFNVHKGEIVGLAGLVGAGRTETAEMIFGIRPVESGEIYIYGKKVNINSPLAAIKAGIGLVSEDRKTQGLALGQSIAENIEAVSWQKDFPKLFVDNKTVNNHAEEAVKELNIMTTSIHKACQFLSGGNQQKVVLAKWLNFDPDILIFDEPTRGIDVGAKMEIYALMDKLATQGKAIIMISSELQEVLGMTDRLYVMHEGVISGELCRSEYDQTLVGSLMMIGEGGNDEE